MNKSFVRRDSGRYSKLGKNRKKLRRWRRPKGRDSKTRLKRKGYPKKVSVGFKTRKGKKSPPIIRNFNELKKLNKGAEIILARLGARKKIDILRKAYERDIKILNMETRK